MRQPKKLSLDGLDLRGKRVLVRVDFNVPLLTGDSNGREVADGTRVEAALPTIEAITRAGGKAILLSHLGRPKGQIVPELSLEPVADYLREQVSSPVSFVPATIGEQAQRAIERMTAGSVLLLENTRFHAGETSNDADFATPLASLGDVFVNDAFGTAHRAHASNVGLARLLPKAAAGYLLQRELEVLGKVMHSPTRPLVVVVGGAKVSDKIGLLDSLASRVDQLLVGGAMAYTFLSAQGKKVGDSLVEPDRHEDALRIAEAAGARLLLPDDHVTSVAIDNVQEAQVEKDAIAPGRMGLDIGPATSEQYAEYAMRAGTVVWNGPMGVFEVPGFAKGTFAMAHALAEATRQGTTTVVGGGDSVAALAQAGYTADVSHVCTGGGAMLDFLEGKTLPGVAALTDTQ